MVKAQKKKAWVEAISDTMIGTLINFPLNIALLSLAVYFQFNVIQTSMFLSIIFIILAVVRKYLIRCYFTRHQTN